MNGWIHLRSGRDTSVTRESHAEREGIKCNVETRIPSGNTREIRDRVSSGYPNILDDCERV